MSFIAVGAIAGVGLVGGLAGTVLGGGKSDSGATPTTPDYSDSTANGVYADANTLAYRSGITAANQMGGVFADGRYYSPDDFEAAKANGQQFERVDDFRGLGSADLAHQQLMQQLRDAPASAQGLLDLQRQYGTQFAAEARNQLAATDPTGFALRDQFGQSLMNGGNSAESLAKSSAQAPKYESFYGDSLHRTIDPSQLPRMFQVDSVNMTDSGRAQAGRSDLENQVFDELSKTGTMDPALQRQTEQAMRARGAASGNLLGDGSALQESLAVQQAMRDTDQGRRANALALLQSGQTTSDKANALKQQNYDNMLSATGFNNAASQQTFANNMALTGFNNSAGQEAFQNAMAAVNQRNQTAQNQFAADNQNLQTQMGARQQDTANIQSFLGLAPVSNQAGNLSAMQNQAAPFATGSYNSGVALDPNAGSNGAQWAGQLYGSQLQLQAAQAQAAAAKSAGTQNMLGNLAGTALRMYAGS